MTNPDQIQNANTLLTTMLLTMIVVTFAIIGYVIYLKHQVGKDDE